MATKYKLQEVNQLQGRSIFIDANVLIYLFWPTGSYYYEQNYARAFGALLKQDNNLYVDIFVISEVVNRILRNEHKKLQPAQNFKGFRDSTEGKQTLSDIYSILKANVLSKFNVFGREFSKPEIEHLLIVDDLDFVDKLTVIICKEKSFVLLTNDKDFRNVDIDILTGNPNLLN